MHDSHFEFNRWQSLPVMVQQELKNLHQLKNNSIISLEDKITLTVKVLSVKCTEIGEPCGTFLTIFKGNSDIIMLHKHSNIWAYF